jgi:cell division protein FtsL
MIGGSSVQGMIDALRNNQKLLRGKRLFYKERSFMHLRREYLNSFEGKLKQSNISKEELLSIRKKIIYKRRKQFFYHLSLIVCILCIATLSVANVFKRDKIAEENQLFIENKHKEKKFNQLIKNGDEWFEKGKWHNSIFYYKKARDIFPDNFEINFRLLNSYGFLCEFEFKNCNDVQVLLNQIILKYPERENELTAIKKQLESE